MDFLESFDTLLELAERGQYIPTLDADGKVVFLVHDRDTDDLNMFLSFHLGRSVDIEEQLIHIEDKDTFQRLFALVSGDISFDAVVACNRSLVQLRETPPCVLRWADLDLTDDDKIRFCHKCQQPVYKVIDSMELFEHIAKNHCIAFFSERREEEDFIGDISFDVEDPNLYMQPHPQNPDFVHITQEGWWSWSSSMNTHNISPKRWFTRTEIEVIKLLDTLFHTLDDGEDNELLRNVAEHARRHLREANNSQATRHRDMLERLINRQIEVDQSQNRDRFAEKDPEFMEYLSSLEQEAERESRIIRELDAHKKD